MIVRLIPLIILLLLRFYHLGVRPPHHDESVNGWFVDGLLSRGYYVYDPKNYHGPLFFYIQALFEKVFGRSYEVLRIPTVIFGSLTTFTPLLFRKWLGKAGTWIAMIFFVFSPAYIFYSRYAIHETLFALTCILFFYYWLCAKDEGFTWKNVWGFGLSLGAMACLKENFVLYGAALVLGEILFWITEKKAPFQFSKTFWLRLLAAVGIAVFIIAVFFSGFFQDENGIPNFFNAFLAWFETGENGNGHAKPFYYWLQVMGQFEWFALFGLIMAPFVVFNRSVPKAIRLSAVVGTLLWLLYSLVAYKTPWCMLAFEWALIFVTSYYFGKWYETKNKGVIIGIMVVGLGVSTYQAIDAAYLNPDQENHYFIYGQTYRDFMGPIQPIIDEGHAHPELHDKLRMQIISSFTWPLPYLLGEFHQVGYFGENNAPQVLDGDYVFIDSNMESKFASRLKGDYNRVEVKARQWASSMTIFTKKK